MRNLLDENHMGNNFLWLADIQRQLKEPLYVDQAHYTAGMSQSIADHIADIVVSRGPLSIPLKNSTLSAGNR